MMMKWSHLYPAAVLLSTSVCNALDLVNYGAFTQSATYSIANQLGVFTAYGLNVKYLQIPNSTYAYAQLVNGGYDILNGLIDNAINRRFTQGINLTILGQVDSGIEVVLASKPSITSIEQLRGRPLLVDSPTSGYVYQLRKVLSLYGLNLEAGDYSLVPVGGTNLRYAALVNGTYNGSEVFATTLSYPFTDYGLAASKINVLASYTDFFSPFASGGLTVYEPQLSKSTAVDLFTRFTAAFLTANRYLDASTCDLLKRRCVINAIAKQLNISTTLAEREYGSATSKVYGEIASPQLGNFTVNRIGLFNTLDLRSQYGGFATVPNNFNFVDALGPGKGKLVDYSILNAAEAKAGAVPIQIC